MRGHTSSSGIRFTRGSLTMQGFEYYVNPVKCGLFSSLFLFVSRMQTYFCEPCRLYGFPPCCHGGPIRLIVSATFLHAQENLYRNQRGAYHPVPLSDAFPMVAAT